jgi:hypothetical protein
MSFPTSPANGSTAVVNGITYSYSTSTTAWTRVASQVTATTFLSITNNTGASSTTTGALQVIGGVGIGGGMFVGGNITATNFIGNFSGTASTATNIAGGLKDQIPYQSAAGITTFDSGLTFNGITFTATNIVVSGTTNATSTTTGALQVAGGLAVVKDLYVGGTLTIGSGMGDIDLVGGDVVGVGRIIANTGTFTTTNITSTLGVTSTNTGALQVAGGVGVGGGIFVGGVVTATNMFIGPYPVSTSSALSIQSGGVGQGTAGTINFSTGLSASITANVATVTLTTSTLMTTAVNLAGGTTDQFAYQTGAGATAFASTASMYVGNAAVANILNAANTSTQQVGFAANLLGNGVANGSLVYQSGPNSTAFLAQGTAGWLLVSQGSGFPPAFTNTSSIYVGNANSANNIIGGAAGSLPYQTGAGATTFLAGGAEGQFLRYSNSAPVWSSTGTFSGGTASANGTANQSVTITSGGLGVTGDSYFSAGLKTGGALTVGSTDANTGTNTSNALYVAGGAWIDKTLVVGGDVTFKGSAVFQGTTTNVISTNTYYTDNILELHTPPTGVTGQWALDDGKDIGFRFHYYSGADNNSALVLSNATKYLTWYETGAENASGVFTTATLGTFQSGRIFAGSTESTSNTQTGALRVSGGVGIAGSVYVGGTVTATTFVGSFAGTASKANNIVGGTAGQLAYQSAPDTTSFVGPGTAGQLLVSDGANAPTYTNTSSIYVNSAVNAETLRGGTAGQIAYQSATGTTAFANSGTTGQFLQATTNGAPTFTNTGSMYVNSAVNAEKVYGGTAGQLVYQSAPGTTSFVGPGTAGQILVSDGTNAPTYTNTSSIYVGNAAVANILNAANTSTQQVGFAANVLAGSQGQIAYQSAANTTAFVNSGTTGQFLQATTNGAPAFTSTGSIYVNSAVNSNNIIGGVKDQIPYQSAAGATTFDNGLTFNGTTFTATNIVVPGTTNATSTVTGALQVAGGLAVAKDLYIGGTLTIAGNSGGDIDLGGGDIIGVGRIIANTGTFTTTNVLSTLGVSSAVTGALQVAGGIGVGGGIFVGGIVTATNMFIGPYAVSTSSALSIQSGGVGQGTAGTIDFSTGLSASITANVATVTLTTSTLMTTAVNLAGGSQGQLAYQTAAGATGFVGPGTAGQILVSAGANAPTYTNTGSIYVGNAAVANVLNAANTSTQQVGFAANLLGNGVANGSLVYQSAANSTAFLAQGTAGWLLVSQGSGFPPAFTTTGSIYVGNANSANNIIGGNTNQIPYQTAAGATTFSSGLTYNGTTLATGDISVTGTTDATSTTTGAFKVVGGAGIGGNLFVGGSAYLTGDLYVDGTSFTVNSNSIATGDKTLTLSTGSSSAALATNSGLQIGTTSTPYASWLYDGSAYWVSGGANAGGIKVSSATGASSTTTGALVVAGGAGFGGNLYVGGVVTATTFIGNLTGTVTTATNLAGGTAGQFAYQTEPGVTAFASTSSMYVNAAVSSQNLFGGSAGQFAYQTAAGVTAFASTSSMYVNAAVSSQNLFGGSAGSISYQTAAGATTFLAGGTAGQFLRYSGSDAPVWSSTGTFSGGTASSSTVATQSIAITSGGLGVTGASYFSTDVGMGGGLNVSGHIVGGGVRSSSTSTVPANATVGDIWYNTSNDTMYRYTNDGETSYWVDINGPAIANGSAAYMTLAAFKAVVAAASSFADFQSRVAAL